MYVSLAIEEKDISFIDSEGDIIYDINKSELGDTIDVPDGHLSAWIFKLAPKSWLNKGMLINLCNIIQEEVPDNDIDWEETYGYIDCFL